MDPSRKTFFPVEKYDSPLMNGGRILVKLGLKRKIVLILIAILSVSYISTNLAKAAVPNKIRVGLMQNGVSGIFNPQGEYLLIDSATGQSIASVKSGDTWEAYAQGGSQVYVAGEEGPVVLDPNQEIFGIEVTGALTKLAKTFTAKGAETTVSMSEGIQLVNNKQYVGVFQGPILIKELQHQDDNSVAFNAIKYRGDMEIRYTANKLTVINELPLEEYLYGVVPKEMPSSWHSEALKAQAMAARNYAIGQKGRFADQGFDVVPTEVCQVYGGLSAEKATTNAAVDATRGKIMLYNGKLVEALYHSSSGGATENSEETWSNKVDYLRTRPDVADANTTHYNWQKAFTQAELLTQLSAKGYKLAEVTDLVVEKMTTSGTRIQILQVIGKDATGQAKTIRIYNADKVRTTFGLKSGPKSLQKTVDPVTNKLTAVAFTGNGWGHGLGMSQYGANGMAKQGNSFAQILQHYYTGIEIVENYNQ